jgi:hypothetical protein
MKSALLDLCIFFVVQLPGINLMFPFSWLYLMLSFSCFCTSCSAKDSKYGASFSWIFSKKKKWPRDCTAILVQTSTHVDSTLEGDFSTAFKYELQYWRRSSLRSQRHEILHSHFLRVQCIKTIASWWTITNTKTLNSFVIARNCAHPRT